MTSEERDLLDSIHFFRNRDPARGLNMPSLDWKEATCEDYKKFLAEPELSALVEEYKTLRKMASELYSSIGNAKYQIIDRKLRELRILGMK